MADFITLTPAIGYGGLQDQGTAANPEPTTLELANNAWKAVEIDIEITAGTILTFEFKSDVEGEIHGIGFDTDDDLSPEFFFQLDGTQTFGLQAFDELYTTGSGFQSYAIAVGSLFTGSFDRIVFAMDDDRRQGADSVFRNVRLEEAAVPDVAVEVNGVALGVLTYDRAQDEGLAITPDPTTLELTDNAWKRVQINQEITADTVLTFEFKSDVEGEIHGIGFDTDDSVSPEFFFQLDGTQTFGLQSFDDLYTTGSGFQSYEIAVGDFFTGSFENLVFVMDDDRRLGADSVFRNIALTERVLEALVDVDGALFAVESYGGPVQDQGFATSTAAGTELSLTDNAWKSAAVNAVITADTVLSFEFKSDVEGEIHGIGFDTDDDLSPEFFFQLDGTQTFGLQAFDDLYTTGSGFQSYAITVGDFFTGTFQNIVFAMDDDRGRGADAVFRNISLGTAPAPVNDAPSFVAGPNQAILEDAGAQTIAGWATEISAGPADEAGQNVSFTVTTDNDALFAVLPTVSADGTLSYELAADANGTATVTVVAIDDGGTANGGVDTSAPQTFTIEAAPVNDAPSFVAGPNQAILEDAGAQTVAGWATEISAGPADEAGQNVSFTVTTDNDALFAVLPTVSTDGTLSYELAADANGTATVTVVAIDDGGTANGGVDTSAPQTFTIEAAPVNDAPSFVAGPNQAILEDAGAQTIAGWATEISAGPADEAGQNVSFTVTTDNDALFAVLPTVSADGTLSYELAADANGTATVTVVAIDDGGTANGGVDTSAPQTFTIEAAPVNDAPSFVAGPNQAILEDAGAQTIAGWATEISAGPADEAGQNVSFTVTTDNDALFAVLPTVSTDGTLSYELAADANGTATVTVVATDDGGTANGGVDTSAPQTFTIEAAPVNDAPSFVAGPNQAILEDAGAQTIAGWATEISAGPADEAGQTVSFTVTTDNDALFAVLPTVSADGTLSYELAADANGTATVTVVAIDDGGTANGGVDTSAPQTFTIEAAPVNDAPSFVAGPNQAILEDAGAQTIAGWATEISAGPADEAGQTVSFTVTTDNDALFAVLPTVSADGTLSYELAADASGTATVTVVATDDGGTANGGVDTSAPQTFTIEAAPVNDAPVIDAIAQADLTETTDTSNIAASIAVTFTDVDLPDIGHSATVTSTGAGGATTGLGLDAAGLAALITPGAVSKAAGSSAGSLSLGFSAASTVFDYLGDGETVTLSYQLAVDDGDGGVGLQGFDIVITGTSDGIAPIELAEVERDTDPRGFVINGVSAEDRSGFSVSSAGDVNGDGLDDLIVGAPYDDPNGSASGASFVVFGKADGGAVALSAVEAGAGGFVINGVSADDQSGRSVSSAGDVNGDGFDDLIVGAFSDDPNGSYSGASFVVFGKADGGVVALSAVEAGTGGFVINGVSAGDSSGSSVSSAGDVNGDGLDDLIVGAFGDDPNGLSSGASFVVFGKADGGAVALSAVEAGTGGFVINGVSAGDQSGASVSSAGDVNGDGLDDLIVGARFDDPNGNIASGASFVVFGKADGGAVALSAVEAGTGGFVINGVSAYDRSGFSVSSAGDVNGDGLDDLIVGADGDDPNGNSSGASFVVFGKADGGAVELSAVEAGTGGFVINGVSAGDFSGISVSSAGDVNGDGLDDLIVGAPLDNPNGSDSGASFVVFGKADGGVVELSAVEAGTGGFVINGVSAGDLSGRSVSSAGDVNGDGFDDLIVGADRDDPNGNIDAGASFVVFGGNFTGAATEVGGVGGDVLTGSAAVDVLIGGTGDDTLVGDGGADVLRGGADDDVLAISDLSFAKVDGGNGVDTLRLDGTGQNLDLTIIADPTLQEIERIDLAAGANTLRLDALELLNLSGETNTLRVLGSTGAVELIGFGWTSGTQITDGGVTFDVLTDGLARIEIATTLEVIGGPIAPIELAEVERDTDPRGFVINGVSADDGSGRSVSSAGDVNGDGLDDLIVGASGDDPNGSLSGASFVVFGKADGGAVALSAVEAGTGGFVINGVSAGDESGGSVSSAGDVNGDGLDDLIVGAPYASPDDFFSGASFVVFGKADGGAVALSAVEAGTGGFVINGVSAGDSSGSSVSSAGDVNGDGLDDLIVGAFFDDPNGSASGASFVVFGKADGGAVELSAVEAGTGGFVINGVSAEDRSGRSVSSAGDVNGDGLDDLIVGAPFDDPNGNDSGASFVVFGKADGGAVALSAVEAGTGGFVINGVSAVDRSGRSVSSAGDVNGDGLDDLIVGAYRDDPNGNDSGASFVVFGKADGGVVALSAVEAGTGGFVINGVSAGDRSGRSVSSAGDVNGDGLDDLIVGAFFDDPNGSFSGASFVVFGKADGGAVELSAVEAGTGGFVINGVSAGDQSGRSVSSAGDVNGDGFDDLIVGAFSDDPNGSYSGASFVVFGGNFTGAATEVGGLGGDVLTGSAAVDVLIGGTGDDTLVGDGGADVLRGGADDDVLAISDLSFAKVDGGNGVDTLRLDGTGQNLDLTIIADPTLQEIERIDLAAGANTLRLDALELLNLSGETNTLRVLGSTGAVELIGFGWTSGTQITDGGVTFDVLTDGLARIEIATTLEVIGGPIAPIELAEVERDTDPRGFVINGVSASDRSGRSVSSAGDVNGDGFDDLIVGASGDDPNGDGSGASFVVFGKADGGAVALSAVEAGTGGFVINGVSAYDRSGFSVSSAGDVNGDGLDDLIVGADGDDPNGNSSGASFVVFGKADGGAVELSAVEAGTGGFVINGVSANDFSGGPVSSAGDVNGDGLDDLIVGALGDDPNGVASGASFVVFGKADGGAVELSAVEAGTGGFVINGVSAGDGSGRSVSSAGDVNGDGLDDLIVGASGDDPNGSVSGASFVVFGKADGGAVALSAVEAGTGGFVINGVSAGDRSGYSVSSAGDVNGDGLDDLIVGAFYDDPNGYSSGASFVVFGKADGGAVALSAVEAGTGGFVINGVSASDYSGLSVSSAGDVNGDGLDDLIVGAFFDDPNGTNSGASFVVFGKADGGAVALSAVEAGTGGFVINGVSADDRSGVSVSSAGDVNGDGFDDLIVGAYLDDPNGGGSGASFVVFGGNFTGAATEIGGVGGDVLTGSAAVDVLIGGTGDDTLVGDGGADVLRGGADDDVLAISDLSFAKVDGGNGVDTLRLDGTGQNLDLTIIADPTLQEIERIDLAAGANTLRLDALELLNLSGETNTLRVLGSTGAVELIGSGWASGTQITDGGVTFDVLTDGLARIEIATTLEVIGGPIAPIELAEVERDTDPRGFVINGVSVSDFSGRSVSSAGDVNGDGLDDLIVGADQDDPNGGSSGASFVVFGKADGGAVALSAVEAGTGGFVINGVSAGDESGRSVSSAGDVNGDGFDDLIVGAFYDDPNGYSSGASFVVFGKADGGAVALSAVEAGTGGFVINGVSAFDFSGRSVSSAGDVNGDGLDDLIVGAFGDDPNGVSSGASFVVFGKADGGAVELSAVEAGTGGFVINGVSAGDSSGSSVSSAGDVNGDGFDDLIVGAFGDAPNGVSSGASFVVFGKADGGAVALSAVEAGTGGFVINGVSAGDVSGFSVSSAGDVNGDGLDDLIVGAYGDDPNGSRSGASFVVFGKADGGAVELSAVEAGTGGFVINGVSAFDQSGRSVSSAGDVNGDGLDDLIVGARGDAPNGSYSGASFVVFGKADGGAVALSAVEAGTGGFVINGVSAGDSSGSSVSSAGDVNGDGLDDLIVGAYGDDPNGSGSGASFVVFGGNFTGAATQVGTTSADVLTGTGAQDVIFAGTGDDTITGNGGADRLSGGQGDDTFVFTDAGGTATITDFEDGLGGQDVLDVSAFGFADGAAVLALASAAGPGGHDVLIQLDADDAILLEDFDFSDLDASDFLT